MRIFITGDDGMVGGNLKKALRKCDGYSSTNICHLLNDDKKFEKYQNGDFSSALIKGKEIDIARHDLDEVLADMQPDLIINCAGLVTTVDCEIYPFYASSVNEAAMLNLVRAVNKLNKKRETLIKIMHFSSTVVYDTDYYEGKIIHEDSVKGPKTIYGISKYGGELIVTNYVPRNLWCIIRPCFLYDVGYSSRVSMMAQWRKIDIDDDYPDDIDHRTILLHPNYYKDYMHVDDFVDIMMRMIFDKGMKGIWGEDFNISLGQPERFGTIQDIFQEHGFNPDRYLQYPHLDYLKNHVVSISKIRYYFPEWQPKISIRAGIRRLLKEEGAL